ncbi:DUF1877 family protein [uncultured Thiocystis sp.]|uniref:DUF1877 family protein n=1 Tax=uncultured Thiocystis sp. TaxID=1202134 RepID=UPI0025E6C6D9|nr:DUF1877 family protein [uncultured Thiocystis sp.]
MSMNLFFQAFAKEDTDAMEQDPSLVDAWVEGEDRCLLSTDVGTAWDILNKLLDGAGIGGGRFIDDVLSNGGEVIDPALVKEHAEVLSRWTHERLLDGLRGLGEGDDAYHLECFQEDEQDLLDEFDKLATFYREAAVRGLAVIHYAA